MERMIRVRIYVPLVVEDRTPLYATIPDVRALSIGFPMTVDKKNEMYAIGPIEEYEVKTKMPKPSFVYDHLD